jgi:hypothetical protein
MNRTVTLVCLTSIFLGTAAAQPTILGGCTIFPANNIWKSRVDSLPVSPMSSTYVNTIGATAHLFPDFWQSNGGGFLNIAPASTPRVPVTATYSTEADPGPFPIPANAIVQDASDLHLWVLSQGNCKLYEMWNAVKNADGSWNVGSAAVYDLQSNIQRPKTWTSADAAGTPMIAGTVTYEELMSGSINHAIAMTVPQTQPSFVWPATHWATYLTGSQYPPMGQRFRLKASFDITPYPFEVQVILTALKKYGAIIDDNGGPWFLTGLQDPRWIDDNLHTITQVLGSNMEAVDDSSLMVSENSSVVAGSPLGLDGIYLDQRLVQAGTVVNGQVILTAPAPSGATVTLSSSNAGAVTIPAVVNVPAGSAVGSFTATVNSIPLTMPVTITASYSGVSRRSPELTVSGSTGQAAALLSALSVTPTTVLGGVSATLTVTLTGAAPAGGVAVALSGSNNAAAAPPSSITVPAGATTASVQLSTTAQASETTVNITASLYGESLTTPLALKTASSPAPVTLRINAGGPAYTDGSGNVWSADTLFNTGFTYSTPAAIAGTSTPSLYQTCRWGAFTYQAKVPNGSYTVNLKFAEIALNGPGQRTFDVSINDVPALANFDIFAEAGANRALDKSFPVTVNNGLIVIKFEIGFVNWPLVSAIEILPAAGTGLGTSGGTVPGGGGTFTPVRVNASGPAYTDGSGNAWSADTGFSGGNTWSVASAITGTTTPALYQTCRWGVFGYTFAAPNGNYTVNLKFAEVSLPGAGRRQFNVGINGTAVLTNFDIYAQAGWLTAIDKSFPVTVSNGQIVIQFTQGAADWPLISAIEIVQASTVSPIRVNASGPAYTDGAGKVWSADSGFSGGNTWTSQYAISGTTTPTLYQTCRWGVFGYNFAVPNGTYTVNLKFAEVTQFGVGRRVFNAAINGNAVLTNFDIYAQAGGLTAIDKSFPVTVSNGQIAIQFTQGAADYPLVSAIEILPH